MARLKLLQPFNNQPAGSVIELPGGTASSLVLAKIAELLPAPRPTRTFELPHPNKFLVNVFEGEDGEDGPVDRYEVVALTLDIPAETPRLKTDVRDFIVPAGQEIDLFELANGEIEDVTAELVPFDEKACAERYAAENGLVLVTGQAWSDAEATSERFRAILLGVDPEFATLTRELADQLEAHAKDLEELRQLESVAAEITDGERVTQSIARVLAKLEDKARAYNELMEKQPETTAETAVEAPSETEAPKADKPKGKAK